MMDRDSNLPPGQESQVLDLSVEKEEKERQLMADNIPETALPGSSKGLEKDAGGFLIPGPVITSQLVALHPDMQGILSVHLPMSASSVTGVASPDDVTPLGSETATSELLEQGSGRSDGDEALLPAGQRPHTRRLRVHLEMLTPTQDPQGEAPSTSGRLLRRKSGPPESGDWVRGKGKRKKKTTAGKGSGASSAMGQGGKEGPSGPRQSVQVGSRFQPLATDSEAEDFLESASSDRELTQQSLMDQEDMEFIAGTQLEGIQVKRSLSLSSLSAKDSKRKKNAPSAS
ncbi:uncharacterized protein LOC135358823 [Latimeria chalumnae]|uniref:uncharacterized protein LOC135358823 n=1 Tax=Latimeria chalumnae TaxID=7897 RepID=UPI00313B6048